MHIQLPFISQCKSYSRCERTVGVMARYIKQDCDMVVDFFMWCFKIRDLRRSSQTWSNFQLSLIRLGLILLPPASGLFVNMSNTIVDVIGPRAYTVAALITWRSTITAGEEGNLRNELGSYLELCS